MRLAQLNVTLDALGKALAARAGKPTIEDLKSILLPLLGMTLRFALESGAASVATSALRALCVRT